MRHQDPLTTIKSHPSQPTAPAARHSTRKQLIKKRRKKSKLPSEKLLSPPASCGECKQAQALPLPWLGAILPPTGELALAQGSCWVQDALYPSLSWAVEPWITASSQGSGSAPLWDGRDHMALPTPGTRGRGRVAHVPQLLSGDNTHTWDLKKTPTRQLGGNPGMDLQGRNRPAPLLAHPTPCLAPGAFSVPNRALGVPFPTVPGTSAGAETPQNTPVPFCQAMARAGTSRAGFLRRLQGLTTLGLLFKFLVFI